MGLRSVCHLSAVLPWDHLAYQKKKKGIILNSKVFDKHALEMLFSFSMTLSQQVKIYVAWLKISNKCFWNVPTFLLTNRLKYGYVFDPWVIIRNALFCLWLLQWHVLFCANNTCSTQMTHLFYFFTSPIFLLLLWFKGMLSKYISLHKW